MKTKFFAAAIFGAVASIMAGPASATILAQDIAGTDTSTATGFFGQSATVGPSGFFDAITFNFYTSPSATTAPGILYIFSSAYTGTAGNLGSGGALASSVSNAGGIYSFAPNFVLKGGVQYFLYESANITSPIGQVTGTYAGGNLFYSAASGSTFTSVTASDADFKLTGTQVPEPVTISLFGAGLAGAAALRRRKKA